MIGVQQADRGSGAPQTPSHNANRSGAGIPHIMSQSVSSVSTSSTTSVSTGLPPIGHRPRSGSAREQAIQAVEYYNSNVLRARLGAGLSGPRSSVNERHLISNRTTTNGLTTSNNHRLYITPETLYRSNSSLELLHEHTGLTAESSSSAGVNLRREYGSHGSIDVISSPTATTSENFFAMLQEYKPAVLSVKGQQQREQGSQESGEFLKRNVLNGVGIVVREEQSSHQSINEEHHISSIEQSASPKLRSKLNRLWGPTSVNGKGQQIRSGTLSVDECALSNSLTFSQTSISSMASHSASTSSADIEERQRRRAFAHFDCQSLTANLGYAAKLRGLLLARRRNTTTGASAASMLTSRSATPDADSSDEDYGDGQCNDLLENCPFFRNEVGSEEEREVSLTRMHASSSSGKSGQQRRAIHRPALACGVSILECPQNETLWKQTTCPFQKGPRPIESVDHGARYYREYFNGVDHQNWFGMDEQLGPVAISLKREKLPEPNDSQIARHQFRMIVRTSELLTLRGSVLEDSIPSPRGPGKPVTTKEVLEYVAPEVQLNCLRLGMSTPQCEQQLIKLDEQGLTNKYKVGILYCRQGQSSEEDMYNNEEASSAFVEFLETVGKRVRLKGFEHYKAGLDNKTDSTGTHSLYATYQDCEIMFHVSTMLPFTPNNRQQLLRKRHIGNDIVTIVFQEPGALPFTPKNIRSQFQHVFIIVRVVNPCSENTFYRVAVSRSKEVPVFGPPIPAGATFPRGKSFADFLLAKVINAENAAHRSEKFATMATRTRQEYLKDLANNYCTTTVVDPGTKFSIFPSKKKEKPKPRFSGDATQRGAFCWQVVLQDSGLSAAVDCFLGISAETFVLVEECTRQIVFVTPCKSILGWSTSGNSLRVYHHQGECVTLNMRDCGERDEQLEVIERLRCVTMGCGALELSLRRNPMGQLGFHVQPDGVVTQVEASGQAWTSGLRQGYRLVEICKVAVATLSHDQMVDLLKTSAQVTVTVIESFPDFSPRRGCFLQNCKFNIINYEHDYEAANESGKGAPKNHKQSSAQLQQPVAHQRRRYERNFSPPRSSNSSGYGTGSSSRSFSIPNEQVKQITDMGTLTSSSSGHSSNDDRWYDILENVAEQSGVSTQEKQHHQQQQHQQQQQHVYSVIVQERNLHNGDHHKLHSTASLPLAGNHHPRPLSLHDPTKMAAVMNDHGRPAPRMANVEYLITKAAPTNHVQNHKSMEAEQLIKSLSLSGDRGVISENGSPNIEPIYNKSVSTTDDELSNDVSPRLKRSATTSNVQKLKNGSGTVSSSSTSSSRNNSPRPHNDGPSSSAAAKLRPGVTHRNQSHLLQRNSVNYTGSSLQEDLMKLINPDYLSSDDNFIHPSSIKNQKNSIANSHSLGNISALGGGMKAVTQNDEFLLKKKSRSREAINFGQQPVPELKKTSTDTLAGNDENEKAEVIYTTARPATVISQNSNSNTIDGVKTVEENNVLHITEGTTPNLRKNSGGNSRKRYEHNMNSQPLPLPPDPNDMDWSSLVDTATRAMMMQFHEEQRRNSIATPEVQQQTSTQQNSLEASHQQQQQLAYANSQSSSSSSQSPSSSLPELQSHLSQLEDRVLRETRRRKSLEHAVRRLTEENRRLQDESQAAVQQLRRFTEWFFQTIDRQS